MRGSLALSTREPPGRLHRLGPALLLVALPWIAGGCDGCGSSKPYTPYTLSDPPPPSASAPASAGHLPAPPPDAAAPVDAAAAPPPFAPIKAAAPSGDGRAWPLDGGTAEAPAGRTFAMGLVTDLDGDGKADLLAFARAPDGLRGELLYASGAAPGDLRTVTALPEGLAGPGCSAVASLTQIGPRAFLFDDEPRCAVRAKAVRWIAVLRAPAGSLPAIASELRVGAPSDGESLLITGTTRDRDGDGRDDISLEIHLTGAPRPLPSKDAAASAILSFFDRPAGLSRDPTEPQASLQAQASALIADGRRKTSAPRVAPAAIALRRLSSMLCEESGKPLFTTNAGPIHCGENHLADDTLIAEIEASLNLGDPAAALAALGRLDTLGPRRKDVENLVGKMIPAVPARLLHKTSTAPLLSPAPAPAPLAFDAGGDLLLHTVDAVLRVDRTSFGEARIDAALTWPSRVAQPPDGSGFTRTGGERRCDEPVLVAHVELQKGGEGSKIDVPLPIAAPPRCAPAASVPVDWLGTGAQGLLVAVQGEAIAFPAADPAHPVLAEGLAQAAGAPVPLGAARSPDGGTVAISTARGVLVITAKSGSRGGAPRLWTGLDADGATLCVPSDGGKQLACAVKDGAAIYEAK
ncbi:MAG: hypothetical protein U0359_37455 [Byssovorax sp.]